MKTIWKYPLDLVEMQTIRIPVWYQPLHVACKNNTPTLWAMVDADTTLCDVTIRVVGTGSEFPDTETWDYLGTSVCDPLVWHIFARVL